MAKESLADAVYRNSKHWCEDKLKMSLNEIDKLCEKYHGLREFSREQMTII